MDLLITLFLIAALLAVLASGLWIGVSLLGVAVLAMQLFTQRPVGDSMALTIWGATSSWTLTALPLFLWMGEILFRTRLADDMFRGLAPWIGRLPGRLLHTNVFGCAIFPAVSGSSAPTCATIGKITLPELLRRGYPEHMVEIEDLDAMRVTTGLAVTITSLGGATEIGHGTVDRVSPRLVRRTIGATDARMRAETRVRAAWVRWDAPGTPIGLRVEAHIALPVRQVETRVPRSAFEIRDGHAQVEVPHYGLFADHRAVELGIADARWVEVKGVAIGTRVAGVAP